MCWACAEEGAIEAYFLAAGKANAAS